MKALQYKIQYMNITGGNT